MTKMDWNNDDPYDRLPATLNFADTLAMIVKRMPKLQPHSYPGAAVHVGRLTRRCIKAPSRSRSEDIGAISFVRSNSDS